MFIRHWKLNEIGMVGVGTISIVGVWSLFYLYGFCEPDLSSFPDAGI